MSDAPEPVPASSAKDAAETPAPNGTTEESAAEAAGEGSSPLPSTGAEPSFEELQQQLQEMEAQQQALAAELEQSNAPQLDQHLAVIEEQFREGFDERFSSNVAKVRPQVWEDQTDILRTNKIFREVSRDMGDEWRPVFSDLMATFPPEVLEEELARLEQQPPIIRGYKALMAWKEIAGPNFTIMKLVDSLRKNDMDDIADATVTILDDRDRNGGKKAKAPAKPVQRRKSDISAKSKSAVLDNRQMLLLAKKIGGDYEGIGKALAVAEEELAEIREDEGSTYQGAFKMLWAWRQAQPTSADSEATLEALKAALQEAGKGHLVEQLSSNK